LLNITIAALTETKRLEEERARKAEEARRITAEKELLQKTQAIKNSSQQKGSKPPPVFNQVHETRQQVWNVVGQQSAAVPVDWTIPKNVQQPPKAPTYHVEPQQPPRTWNPITAPIPATIPMPNSKIPSKQTTQSSQKPVAQKVS
jgi:hypothetical protein